MHPKLHRLSPLILTQIRGILKGACTYLNTPFIRNYLSYHNQIAAEISRFPSLTCRKFRPVGMVFDVGGSRRILEPDGSTHPKSRCSETIRYEKSTHRGNIQVILPQYQVQVWPPIIRLERSNRNPSCCEIFTKIVQQLEAIIQYLLALDIESCNATIRSVMMTRCPNCGRAKDITAFSSNTGETSTSHRSKCTMTLRVSHYLMGALK